MMPTAQELIDYLARMIEKDAPIENRTLIKDIHFRMQEQQMHLTVLQPISMADPNERVLEVNECPQCHYRWPKSE